MSANSGGPAPFGFEWNGNQLVATADEARVRRKMFELFAQHKRKGTVARLLNEAGHRTRRNAKWTDVSVGRLLRCPSAKGEYVTNTTMIDDSGQRVPRPQEEWNFIKCEPIVPQDLWDRVARILARQAESAAQVARPGVHLATGFTYCACGAKMTVPKDSQKYVCPACHHKIPATDLEAAIYFSLETFLGEQAELFEEIVEGGDGLARRRGSLDALMSQIREIEGRIAKHADLYAAGQLSEERFGKLNQPLEEQLGALEDDAAKHRAEINSLPANPNRDEATEADPGALLQRWPTLGIQAQRHIAEAFLKKLTVGEDHIEIVDRFPPPRDADQDESSLPGAGSTSSPKEPPSSQRTAVPTNETPASSPDEPIYIRLPKSGERCPRTGLSRSMLNKLVLPSQSNGYKAPVRSIKVTHADPQRGARLILWASLKRYLENRPE